MNIILFEGEKIPDNLPLRNEKAQHILKILRLKEGDTFLCGLVNGPSGYGRIKKIDTQGITLSWEKAAERKALYPVTLLVGYTRPVSSKRILRETVSLGVERIIFCATDTGEKSYRGSSLWKKGGYRKYLIDGAQQAGETAIPEIHFYSNVKAVLEAIPPEEKSDFLVLDNIQPTESLSCWVSDNDSAFLAIGSERGWSNSERDLFRQRGFTALSLGNRILRTETACSAGCAVLLSRMGYL